MDKNPYAVEVYKQHTRGPRKRVEALLETHPGSKQKGLINTMNYWYRDLKHSGHVFGLVASLLSNQSRKHSKQPTWTTMRMKQKLLRRSHSFGRY